jgi:hypothetical protein
MDIMNHTLIKVDDKLINLVEEYFQVLKEPRKTTGILNKESRSPCL